MGRLRIAAGSVMLLLPSMVSAQVEQAPLERMQPYRINAGDELEVYVWGEERLQRVVRVLPDGSFAFPLVGRVDALGMLPAQVEALISKGLQGQFRNQVPQITVSVKTPAGLQFSVIGKVKTPGSFAPGRYVNVLEAISLAGGPSEFAQIGNVLILRRRTGGLAPIRVRLTEALKGNPSARDLQGEGLPNLVSGDTIVVP